MQVSEILKRPYARVLTPEADGQYTAEIMEFPNCVAFGPSAVEALASLEQVAADWIGAALEQGQDIPEPMDNAEYSGRLVLRMPKGLHRRAALLAEREGVSLNYFIVTSLAESVGEKAKPQMVQLTPVLQAEARLNFQFLAASPYMGAGTLGTPQGGLIPMATGSGKTVQLAALRALLEPDHA